MDSFLIKQSSIEGKGIFAARIIKKGQVIFSVAGPVIQYAFEPNYRAGANYLQVAENAWKMPLRGNPWHFINHACRPNAGLQGHSRVVAMRDIKIGEEVTIDYSITEASRTWRMHCRCGVKTCRKIIRSVRFLPSVLFEKYKAFVPAYLQRAYREEKTFTSRVKGEKRLFARHAIKKGEKIFTIEGPIVRYPFAPNYRLGYRWYAIAKNTWIIPLAHNPWASIRHSCAPNAGFRGTNMVVAMRKIQPGDEIVVDDAMTEADPNWHHACHCGAKSCRKTIRSVQSFTKFQFPRLTPYLSPFLKRIYFSGKTS